MALLMKQLAWIGPQIQGVPTSFRKLMFFPVLLVSIMCSVFLHLCVMEHFSITLMDLCSLLLIFSIVHLFSLSVLEELCAVCVIVTVI